MGYFHQISDRILLERIEAFGALLIERAKCFGKAITVEQIAISDIKLQDTEVRR